MSPVLFGMICFDFYSFCLGPEGNYSLNPKIIISVDISVSLFALSFPFILHMAENRSPFPHPLKCPFHYFLLLICSILMPRALTSSLLSLQSCSIDTSSCHWILISKDYAFHVRTSILPLFQSLSLSNTVPLVPLSPPCCAVLWHLWSMQTSSVSQLWEHRCYWLLRQLCSCSSFTWVVVCNSDHQPRLF